MRKTVARASRPAVCVLLLPIAVFAAIDGRIVNATKATPAANVPVTLVSPGKSGMQTLATTKSDATGNFTFDKTADGPTLIQAVYQGVTYNKMVMPGAPSSGLEVSVYDSTNKPGTVQVDQHMILVQPTAEALTVNEVYSLQDKSNVTYNDPAKGTLQFYLPPETNGKVQVTVNAPGGMPVQRPAIETPQKGVYKIDYPIKPGETRIDLAYSLPMANPNVLEGKVLHKEGKARLVAPAGVTLSGANIRNLGVEPTTQAAIYEVDGNAYKVTVEGTGALQRSEQPDEDSGQPPIREVKPHIYDHMYWIMGLTLAILALGSLFLARATEKQQ